jgi:hypothetical protein
MHRALQQFRRFLPHLSFVALLLWGGYVLFYYIGIDAHIVVLLRDPEWQKIAKEVSGPVMRGVHALVPFLEYLFERLLPFAGYAVACVVLYAAAMTYTVLRHGRMFFDFRLSSLHILGMGVLSLWLIFTTLFYAKIPGIQPRLIVEPQPQVYENVSEQTLTALRENFVRLQQGGCLKRDTTRNGPGGAGVYFYRGICVQKAFFTKALLPLLMLLLLVFDFLVAGSFLLRLIRLKPVSLLIEFVVSLAIGAAAIIALLWSLAFLKSMTMIAAWVLLAAVPIVGFRHLLYWLRVGAFERFRITTPFHSVSVLLFWLLISYIAFNFLTVVRPFPIGWDDLGRYINAPRQLSVFNQILPQISAMQWEYLTSLGFVLFGYFSAFGATLAQQINWLAGILAVLSVYVAAKVVLGPRAGLIAALFYYTMPMVGHFSFADMKTENALFFFSVVGLIAALLYIYAALRLPHSGLCREEQDWRWLLVAGFLCAAGFATKPTIILMFFLIGVLLSFALLGRTGGWGSVFLSFAVLIVMSPLSPADILRKAIGYAPSGINSQMTVLFLFVGLVLLLAPFFLSIRWPLPFFRRKLPFSLLRSYLIAASVLVGGFLLFSAPWFAHNMYLQGSFVPTAALKMPNTITPQVRYTPPEPSENLPPGSRGLPPELQVDLAHERCTSTAGVEELDRYWGHGSGLSHYTELPWRVVMNRDSQGYYLVTSPLLLLVPLLLLLPLFWGNVLLRLLFWGTALYLLEWIFIASGIPWYGIGLFVGFAVFVEALISCAPNKPSKFLAGVFVFLAIGMTLSLRMWQFGMQQNLYEYSWGKASYEVLREMTIPDYDDIADRIVELSKNPDRPYLYRMGTFISYFVPRNLEIIVRNDNQLDFFNCLNQEGDHALTLRRLQALGIHSIVFDTNTATIEKDPNGTLHQKVQRFLDFANDPELGIIPVVNNPGGGIAYMILP